MLAVVVLSVVLFKILFLPIRVTGSSMEPSYRRGHLSLLNQWAYRRQGPQRGDVVGFQQADRLSVVLKRIVGLPGERVAIFRGRVYIDGERLKEPYAQGKGIRPRSPIRLGPDEYFAIGDNRTNTTYGVVKASEIKGKIVF
jgi:signal peptidase I